MADPGLVTQELQGVQESYAATSRVKVVVSSSGTILACVVAVSEAREDVHPKITGSSFPTNGIKFVVKEPHNSS